MKRYFRKFQEDKKNSPFGITAEFFIKNSEWKKIKDDSKQDTLKKGDEYTQATISSDKGSQNILLKVTWKNKNGVLLGSILYYDNKKEIEDEGWIVG